MNRWLGVVALCVAGFAHAADPPPSWFQVQRALVNESIDGDATSAVRAYEDLVHNKLTTGDPSLSDALYWLAAARWSLGDVRLAREALDQCIRSGVNKGRCIDLRSHIDLEQDSVRRTPVSWAFDDLNHGFFHPREFWDRGSIRILAVGSESVLAWNTQVDPMSSDSLVVGFREPYPAPSIVRFQATSMGLNGTLELALVDVYGKTFAPRAARWPLPQGQTTIVEIRLDTATSGDGELLNPSDLHRLVVRDVTGVYGNLGPNEIRIDNFMAR